MLRDICGRCKARPCWLGRLIVLFTSGGSGALSGKLCVILRAEDECDGEDEPGIEETKEPTCDGCDESMSRLDCNSIDSAGSIPSRPAVEPEPAEPRDVAERELMGTPVRACRFLRPFKATIREDEGAEPSETFPLLVLDFDGSFEIGRRCRSADGDSDGAFGPA